MFASWFVYRIPRGFFVIFREKLHKVRKIFGKCVEYHYLCIAYKDECEWT